MDHRLSAARAAGITTVFAPEKRPHADVQVIPVRNVVETCRRLAEPKTADRGTPRTKGSERVMAG
jgi:hypothetical protein